MALLETTGHEAPREEERESILTPRKYMFDGLTEPETLARDATSVLKERKQVNSLVFHSLSILWERNFAHWMVEFCFVLFWFGLFCFFFCEMYHTETLVPLGGRSKAYYYVTQPNKMGTTILYAYT